MSSTLNSKDYVTFARRFVKETVDTMDIEELRSIVSQRIHEEIQEGENTYGHIFRKKLNIFKKDS